MKITIYGWSTKDEKALEGGFTSLTQISPLLEKATELVKRQDDGAK